MLGILRRQHHGDLIPRYLDHNSHASDLGNVPALQIANETGFFPGFRGDVALVETAERRVILAVLAADGADRGFQTENAIAQVIGQIGQLA